MFVCNFFSPISVHFNIILFMNSPRKWPIFFPDKSQFRKGVFTRAGPSSASTAQDTRQSTGVISNKKQYHKSVSAMATPSDFQEHSMPKLVFAFNNAAGNRSPISQAVSRSNNFTCTCEETGSTFQAILQGQQSPCTNRAPV